MTKNTWFSNPNPTFNRALNRNCFTKPVPCVLRSSTPVYTFSRLTKIGFALTSGSLASLSYKRWALCEAPNTRLAGYKVSNDQSIRFDWQKFWLYLKPHFWYIIAAIAVSLFYIIKGYIMGLNSHLISFKYHYWNKKKTNNLICRESV